MSSERSVAGATGVDPARRAFLDARREGTRRRYDELHAEHYDREWGAISPSHARFVGRLMELTRPKGLVLDAACGTGKYWPMVLASGRTAVGVDQSAGMLRAASAKFPNVPVAVAALQDLAFDAAFDAVMCVDAMEMVGPEDWPPVLDRLRAAVRPGAHLYVTIELADPAGVQAEYDAARASGAPVLPGECFDGVGYHYYPTREAVDAWFARAGLRVIEEDEGDDYRHVLLRRA